MTSDRLRKRSVLETAESRYRPVFFTGLGFFRDDEIRHHFPTMNRLYFYEFRRFTLTRFLRSCGYKKRRGILSTHDREPLSIPLRQHSREIPRESVSIVRNRSRTFRIPYRPTCKVVGVLHTAFQTVDSRRRTLTLALPVRGFAPCSHVSHKYRDLPPRKPDRDRRVSNLPRRRTTRVIAGAPAL